MEPTGVDGLWGKGECGSFTHFFLNVIILLVKRATCFAPNQLARRVRTNGAGCEPMEPGSNRAKAQQGHFSNMNRCGEETAKLAL